MFLAGKSRLLLFGINDLLTICPQYGMIFLQNDHPGMQGIFLCIADISWFQFMAESIIHTIQKHLKTYIASKN